MHTYVCVSCAHMDGKLHITDEAKLTCKCELPFLSIATCQAWGFLASSTHFLKWILGLISGSHAYMVGDLLTEPSPQPLNFITMHK